MSNIYVEYVDPSRSDTEQILHPPSRPFATADSADIPSADGFQPDAIPLKPKLIHLSNPV